MKSDIKIYPMIPTRETLNNNQLKQYGLIEVDNYKAFYEIINNDIYLNNNIQIPIPSEYHNDIISKVLNIFPGYDIYNGITSDYYESCDDSIRIDNINITTKDGAIIKSELSDDNKNDILNNRLLECFYYDDHEKINVDTIKIENLRYVNKYIIHYKEKNDAVNNFNQFKNINFSYDIDNNIFKISSNHIVSDDIMSAICSIIKSYLPKEYDIYCDVKTCKSLSNKVSNITLSINDYGIITANIYYINDIYSPILYDEYINELKCNSLIYNSINIDIFNKLYKYIPFLYIDMNHDYDKYNFNIITFVNHIIEKYLNNEIDISDISFISINNNTIKISTNEFPYVLFIDILKFDITDYVNELNKFKFNLCINKYNFKRKMNKNE